MRHYAGLKHEHTKHKEDQDPDQRVREDDSVPQFACDQAFHGIRSDGVRESPRHAACWPARRAAESLTAYRVFAAALSLAIRDVPGVTPASRQNAEQQSPSINEFVQKQRCGRS
jgi:hypothetical protein